MERNRLVIVAVVLSVLLILLAVAVEYFKVEDVSVEGSGRYSAEEIEDMVMKGPLGHNSLYLLLRYKNKPITDLPFIARTDVTINSPSSVTIRVYEKAIAAYVTGLDFDECVLSKPLPVEDASVFKTILSITQLLEKYEITAERIYFDGPDNITLYFGDARVIIGSMENIDEKMMKLKSIISSIRGLSGELHLEEYSVDSDEGYITFEKDE